MEASTQCKDPFLVKYLRRIKSQGECYRPLLASLLFATVVTYRAISDTWVPNVCCLRGPLGFLVLLVRKSKVIHIRT